MKTLRLKYITEKGKIAINKQNEKNKKDWKLRATIRATGGKITFIEGGMEFRHFILNKMNGDLNSTGNSKSDNMKKKGFETIEKALKEDGCSLNIDYSINLDDD